MTYYSVMFYNPKYFRRERINVAVLIWDGHERVVVPLPPNGKQRLTSFLIESPLIISYDDVAEMINQQCDYFLSAKGIATWYLNHRQRWQPNEIDIDLPQASKLSVERLAAAVEKIYL